MDLRTMIMAGASLAAFSSTARAQAWPSQPIRFVIPYGPGGTFDSYGRKFAQALGQSLHATVAPINSPGAAGKKAIFQLLQEKPDGYMVSLAAVPGILMSDESGPIDLKKLTWVANLGRDVYGLAVGKNSAIKKVADLKALSAKRPVVFASTGKGSTDYFATKVFAATMGVNVRLVSGYNDSPNTVIAVTRGDVDCVVHSLATLKQMQASGLVRTLFVFPDHSGMPGVEDAAALGKPDLGQIFQWRPVCAPPAVPAAIVSRLSGALVAAAKSPDIAAWAAKLETNVYPLDAAATRAMIQTQSQLVAKWRSVL